MARSTLGRGNLDSVLVVVYHQVGAHVRPLWVQAYFPVEEASSGVVVVVRDLAVVVPSSPGSGAEGISGLPPLPPLPLENREAAAHELP